MSILRRNFRENPYFANFVGMSVLIFIPMAIYLHYNVPDAHAVKKHIEKSNRESLYDMVNNSKRLTSFWTEKRDKKEMEVIYDKLLRSGTSDMKRYNDLRGPLLDLEIAEDTEYGKEAAILTKLESSPPK